MVFDHHRLCQFDNWATSFAMSMSPSQMGDSITPREYLHIDDFQSKASMVFNYLRFYQFDNLHNTIPKEWLHQDVLQSRSLMVSDHHRLCLFDNLRKVNPKEYLHHNDV